MLTVIEDGFFELLQSDVILTIDGKRYREGRFQNFRIKDFYIQIDLVVNDKLRHVDVPIPFRAEYDGEGVILSYQLTDMSDFGDEVSRLLKRVIGSGRSKLYDKCLRIDRSN